MKRNSVTRAQYNIDFYLYICILLRIQLRILIYCLVYSAQENSSTIIEVRLRPRSAQWRYRLDVLAGGQKVYFDRPALKFQHFQGELLLHKQYCYK